MHLGKLLVKAEGMTGAPYPDILKATGWPALCSKQRSSSTAGYGRVQQWKFGKGKFDRERPQTTDLLEPLCSLNTEVFISDPVVSTGCGL